MKLKSFLTALTLTAIITISSSAHAAPTAEDAIKYRHLVMESMAAHIGALMLVLLDKVDVTGTSQHHADALVNATAELDQLFPEISREGETDALPAIWNDPKAFSEAVSKAQTATSDLQTAVTSGDRKAALGAASAVGKSCKGCHESYRAEHDDDH